MLLQKECPELKTKDPPEIRGVEDAAQKIIKELVDDIPIEELLSNTTELSKYLSTFKFTAVKSFCVIFIITLILVT